MLSYNSKARLNTIKFDSKVTHGRSHFKTTKYWIHTKYRSLLGKVTKSSENNITAILIMNLVLEIFSQYDLHNIFKIFIDRKK